MKVLIFAVLITLALSVQLTPEQQILAIPGCQTTLSAQLNVCSNVDTTQANYFQKYYQCIYQDANMTQPCASVYCKELGQLDAFGVNCTDFSVNFTDITYTKKVVPMNINMSCNIGEISGCLPLLNGLEPYCQTVTSVHDLNYFSDFFDCIIANTTMQAVEGCSKCYCLRSRFNDYGVDCNRTKPLTPQQQIEAIPGCENALNKAVASCQSVNDTQDDYYHKFYMCINANPLIRTVSPTCPLLYCNEIEHLNVFGVNCMNFTYDLSNTTNQTHTPTWRNLTCRVEKIDGCTAALNTGVPQCQKEVPSNATNYYESFFNCVKSQETIKLATGCASCYCMNLELNVDCGATSPSPAKFVSQLKKLAKY